MAGRLFGLLFAAAVALPASATAAPVLVMGRGGHVTVRNDRFLTARLATPRPASGSASTGRAPGASGSRRTARIMASTARAPTHPQRAPERTVVSELARLYRSHQLSGADYRRYSASFAAALAVKRLRGTRATELEAVVQNLHAIAAARGFVPSRLPALFLTLDRNRQWWTTGPIPYSGQLIEFQGSQLVWEYYPGQGLELQVLATFGRADGLYTAGASEYAQMSALLREMLPLAVQRGGGIAWEYYFQFDGGSPPWVSAMAQGTAIEALTRASKAFGAESAPSGLSATPQLSGSYLQIAQRALGIFTVQPPAGVAVAAQHGARYLQYSFAPRVDIINAFLQSLIGLYDYAHVSGNTEAQRLFAAGNAQARAELPSFDTGAWSLYQPGIEDTLDYHQLVTGFLDQLCSKTGAAVYCTTAQHFHAYMTTPPALQLFTTTARAHKAFAVRFHLSKYSRVGIVVARGQRTVFATSRYFPHGVDAFAVPSLSPGSYTIRLAATDLPGNFNRIIGALQLSAQRHSP